MTGFFTNIVGQFDQSETFDISGATYDSVSFSADTQDTGLEGVSFSTDGTKMYISGDANDKIWQYTLSTPWDLSTASYASKFLDVSAQDTLIQGHCFTPDGATLYVLGADNDTIDQYTVATPWDLSTASYASKSKAVGAQDGTPQAIYFRDGGTRMFMVGSATDAVYQYTLGTPYDISTATYDSVSFSIAGQQAAPQGMYVSPGGSILVTIGLTPASAHQYEMSTPWDLSTASYTGLSKSVGAQDGSMSGIFVGKKGTKMYTCGDASNDVFQYSLPIVP